MTVVAFHRLEVEGSPDELRVIRWRGRAALNAPFALEVLAARAEAAEADPAAVLGAPARLHLAVDAAAHALGGVVDAIEATDEGTVFRVVPPVARLAEVTAHRVTLDVDGLSLAETVLRDHDVELERRCASTPRARPQRVSAFESELSYAARLLAEEGICWFSDQDGAGATTVVLADGPAAFAPITGEATLPFRPDDGFAAGEAITALRLSHRLTTDRVAARDFAFDKPLVDLAGAAGDGPNVAYRFVGPGWFTDPAAGEALAQRLLEVERREAVVLEASSSCHRLWPGRTFVLEGAPRDDLNRSWLVIEAALEGHEDAPGEAPRLSARIRAIPADVPWRPAVAPTPSMGGVQTATIVGPAGEEIHTDAHGRVRAKLRYADLPDDDTASAWTRVIHPPTSGGFMLPRTGWEALVGFARDSGDEPYVIGRLDNGGAPTAESLPAKQVCGNFGTPTTPGGGSSNMIRMTDTAGAEDMALTASRDWKEQTASNKSTSVKGNVSHTIGANHTVSCEANRGLKVDAPQSLSVGGNRKLTAASGVVTQAGAEIVGVGGTRSFTVGGDEVTKVGGALSRSVGGAKVIVATVGNNRHVDGACTMAVGGAWLETGATAAMSVAGASTLTCSATAIKAVKYSLSATALSETCGARTETAPNVGWSSDGAMALTFGATTINAPTVVIRGASITVTAGGGILSVKPGSVTFTGVLNAGGHVRSPGDAKHG